MPLNIYIYIYFILKTNQNFLIKITHFLIFDNVSVFIYLFQVLRGTIRSKTIKYDGFGVPKRDNLGTFDK